MATHDYVIANGTGAAVRSDLNNALAAIVSNNSGTSEPATTYAYQWWADTTNNVLKIRNSANNAWITLRELDGTMLIEDGSASSPGLAFADDTNTGIFSGSADQINFATGGAERLKLDGTETVFNNPSNDVDFRVESNGQTHMLYVNAGTDRIGIGHSSPGVTLDVAGEVRSHHTSDSRFLLEVNDVNRGGFMATTDAGVVIYGASSTNPIRFQTSGSEQARIDTSGRLLVGTSSARANFYNTTNTANILVEGLDSTSSTIAAVSNKINTDANNEPTFVLGRSGTNSLGSTTIVADDNAVGRVSFQGTDGSDFVECAHIRAFVDGTPGSNDMPGRLTFSTTADGASSPTERLRIDSSGNVGIGTTSPDSLLTLDASSNPTINIKTSGTKRASLIADTGNSYALLGSFDGYPLVFSASAGGGTAERMRIDTSGRLLIGTSSSRGGNFNNSSGVDAQFQIEGTSFVTSFANIVRNTNDANCGAIAISKSRGTSVGSNTVVQSGDKLGELAFQGSDGSKLVAAAEIECEVDNTPGTGDMPGKLLFKTTADGAGSTTERMQIRSDGRVGIGTSFPTTDANTTIYRNASGNFALNLLQAHSSGHVLSIGGDGPNVVYFYNSHLRTGVAGTISKTATTVSYNTSSDYRMKENVVDLDGAISRVKQLAPKRFNFIVDADTTVDGFLAHEAQTVVPEAVTGTHNEVDDDGNAVMQGIDQSKLVPLLTAALQEAIAKIETLETKVAALEAG